MVSGINKNSKGKAMGNIEDNQNPVDEMVTIKTPVCVHCGQSGEVNMLMSEYKKLLEAGHIQDALPNHSANDREMLMTGTHPACWDAIWAEYEDGDE